MPYSFAGKYISEVQIKLVINKLNRIRGITSKLLAITIFFLYKVVDVQKNIDHQHPLSVTYLLSIFLVLFRKYLKSQLKISLC